MSKVYSRKHFEKKSVSCWYFIPSKLSDEYVFESEFLILFKIGFNYLYSLCRRILLDMIHVGVKQNVYICSLDPPKMKKKY